jgi:hypothetical protein
MGIGDPLPENPHRINPADLHRAERVAWDLDRAAQRPPRRPLAKDVQGLYHMPFEQLYTEGAYQVGATYERTNIQKRTHQHRCGFGVQPSAEAYRKIETNWWDSWPPDQPGWLGCHTPTGGWRWCQVQQAKPSDTSMPTDPTAFGNNGFRWDMQLVATKPWWAKRMLYETWTSHPATTSLTGYDNYTFHIANRGNLAAYPKFLYSGKGRLWIQDWVTGKQLPMPQLSTDDGTVLIDTDPAERTFTGEKDAVDNIFYQYIAPPGCWISFSTTSNRWGWMCGAALTVSASPGRSRRARWRTSKCGTTNPTLS